MTPNAFRGKGMSLLEPKVIVMVFATSICLHGVGGGGLLIT